MAVNLVTEGELDESNKNLCTVMIIDAGQGLRILLEDFGCTATLVENEHVALRRLYRLEVPPCLILLNLMMPTMN